MKELLNGEIKPRFVLKKKKIVGRGGGPKIDNWEIWDTKENRKYNDCIVEQFARKLCDDLNKFYKLDEEIDNMREVWNDCGPDND